MLRSSLLCGSLLILFGITPFVHSQSCENYFNNSVRLAAELKRPAEFRVRMGTVVDGRLIGDQLFGAGRILPSRERDRLEGDAYFHWIERRDNPDVGTLPYRLLRREQVHLSLVRSGNAVRISLSGGKETVQLVPECSGDIMYAMDLHENHTTKVWIFQLPFPYCLDCQNASVLTQRNDMGRSGAYLNEGILTPQAVRGSGSTAFEHLFTLDVDGQIYAQPLYVPGVKLADGTYHNVLYVATTTNHVYAFDADNALNTTPLFNVVLGVPADPSFLDGSYNVVYPYLGITATPVIDLASKKMYVEAKIVRTVSVSHSVSHRSSFRILADEIFALDITSPQQVVVDWAEIGGSYQGVDFNSNFQKSRPGLLLLNGRVYAAFGELNNEGDQNRPYYGWIFSFDASDLSKPPAIYNPTPNYIGAGIWQSGTGLASDGTYIYFNTGNGSVEGQDGTQFGFQPGQIADSVLKLNTDLTLAQSYTPPNVKCLDTCDLDLGSAGPVLFPNSDVLLSSGKEGIFYVFSKKNIGQLSQCAFRAADQNDPREQPIPYCSLGIDQNGCETPDPRKFCGTGGEGWLTEAHGYSNIHGSPVVLPTGTGQYQVYVWPEENTLRMFKYKGDQLLHSASQATGPDAKAPPLSMPGGILALSAEPSGANAIVWGTVPQACPIDAPCSQPGADPKGDMGALDASIPGTFVAFDANTLIELWADTNLGYFAKNTPPTIANGKVYVANFGDLSENCGGNYNHQQPKVACGHVRVYGLRKFDIHIPIELVRWPYVWIDPGPLTPGEVEEMRRRMRGF